LLAKRLIRYEMIPLHLRKPASVRDWVRFVSAGFRTRLPKAHRAFHADPLLLDALSAQGCVVIKLDDPDLQQVTEVSRRYFNALSEKRQESSSDYRPFDASRICLSEGSAPDLYKTLLAALNKSGVIELASNYLGRQAALVDTNPQINDVTDSFWNKIFPDLPPTTLPKNSYFHRDASGGDLKAILYITDVNPQNGPFSYALGSHKMKMTRIDDLICENNDYNGLAGTDPEARARFSALPRLLRQKGAFGNDIDDQSELSRAIQAHNWEITAPGGSIVLFDTKGIHRGGMVIEGERRVITCVLG